MLPNTIASTRGPPSKRSEPSPGCHRNTSAPGPPKARSLFGKPGSGPPIWTSRPPALEHIDAEEPDLNVGPTGTDEAIAVLQALIAAAARLGRIFRLHEGVVDVVVVGADLHLRLRRAEPWRGGDHQAE